MANGIRTGDPRGFNKGRSSKFREGSRVRQTPEEGRRTYRSKRCRNNNKDEDNSPKNLNDKNQQGSSQKFRQVVSLFNGKSAFVVYLVPKLEELWWYFLTRNWDDKRTEASPHNELYMSVWLRCSRQHRVSQLPEKAQIREKK